MEILVYILCGVVAVLAMLLGMTMYKLGRLDELTYKCFSNYAGKLRAVNETAQLALSAADDFETALGEVKLSVDKALTACEEMKQTVAGFENPEMPALDKVLAENLQKLMDYNGGFSE